jgi:hypothetical protein
MANITLLIERVGDELEVTVQDDPGDDQKGRRGAAVAGHGRNREMKEQKRKRKQHDAGGHDHDLASGQHQTMILIDGRGDTVTFKCATVFTVDVEFDPTYLDPGDPEPQRSPFNWAIPQTGTPGGGGLFVVGPAAFNDAGIGPKTRPSDHHFYKMTIWSGGLKMDPDWYCDR